MSFGYKTILAHFDSTDRAGRRLQIAARLAERHDAHLAAVYSIMSPLYSEPFVADGGAFVAQELLRFQEKKDAEARAAFERIAPTLERPVEWRSEAGDPAAVVNEHGRYADLIVVGQYDDDAANDVTPDFIGRVIMGSGRPVLVVPYTGEFPTVGRRPMLAWNASRESARATSSSMPLLRDADEVQVTTFNARAGRGGHGDVPGADIAGFLARHGVKANVSGTTSKETDIGNQILSRADDFNADLIIMGGYGHSRAYEFVMGGATRTVLESMTVPVLFAH
ncbi:MAG: universal stress protein [Burkholderiales bacterium]|jgi:nucleotide-binding universal stress UspA family protein